MFSSPAVITSHHDVRNFDCGNTALNEFLAKFALTNSGAGIARTYVVTLTNQPAVVGLLSRLPQGRWKVEAAPDRVAKGTPRHPIPVALLARLAVDSKYQKQGLGESMLKHALLQIVNASNSLGIRAVLVHAKNETAANFYLKHGFEVSPVNSLQLMLMLKDIKKSIESA